MSPQFDAHAAIRKEMLRKISDEQTSREYLADLHASTPGPGPFAHLVITTVIASCLALGLILMVQP